MLIGVGYLIGSIPVGVLVGRAFGFDPRAVGSGNVGMTNVARAGGKVAAALTFAGDLLKGLIPVVMARWVGLPVIGLALVGFAAFLGSIASIFLRFTGGRGVATSLGLWLGLAPVPAAIAAVVFALILAASRIVSLASISGAIVIVPAVAVLGYPRPYILLAIVVSSLVLLRHRANIGRLIARQEPRIGERKSKLAG
jgi:acyl phosphate:glycerol-3-phosphate acyltransferase